MADNSFTQHAPTRRSDALTIDRQKKMLADHYDSLKRLYDALSELILIVNQDRQIVFFNSVVPSVLGIDNPDRLYGLRPGEALGCTYACINPGGCGTSEFCSQCGAVNAILSALVNKDDLQECMVLKSDSLEAMDLLVRTTPLEIEGQMFCIMAILDISHEKRRRALEKIFFHDIMNTAASNKLMAEMLNDNPEGDSAEFFRQNLLKGTYQLIEELLSQKQLLAAENRELKTDMAFLDGNQLVNELVEVFRSRFCGQDIVVAAPNGRMMMNTDRGLLQRVLGNMILNAIEACQPGDVVTVTCTVKDGQAEFCVHNPCCMAEEVRLKLFQRSFSTKGSGRGLGTYSMKLLTERYLNGSVKVISNAQHGTTFVVRYPLAADPICVQDK